jgi:peptidoglycan/xylan/chitin deacetylase (PgdA/CDA1 family)
LRETGVSKRGELLVVVTMDCERVRTETRDTASGPPDYVASARWIEAYWRIAAGHGWPVSFFVHPEVASAHPSVFLDLAREGATLGLHLHPWKFGDGTWRAHLGQMPHAKQKELLGLAAAVYADALGEPPLHFRPGTFSANDATFQVLTELGFRGGSISAPERIYAELFAVWASAPRDPHRCHECFRLAAGDLPFANMPLSVDFSTMVDTGGRRFGRDLRPDYQEADYETIATNIVAQVLERRPAVPVINLVTHNDNDYGDPNDRVCRHFRRVLDAIEGACARRGVTPRGATMAEVADLVLGAPVADAAFETVGVIHGSRSAGGRG